MKMSQIIMLYENTLLIILCLDMTQTLHLLTSFKEVKLYTKKRDRSTINNRKLQQNISLLLLRLTSQLKFASIYSNV